MKALTNKKTALTLANGNDEGAAESFINTL